MFFYEELDNEIFMIVKSTNDIYDKKYLIENRFIRLIHVNHYSHWSINTIANISLFPVNTCILVTDIIMLGVLSASNITNRHRIVPI